MLEQATPPRSAPPRSAPTPPRPAPADAARALEREIDAAGGGRAWPRRGVVAVAVVLVASGIVYWRIRHRPPPPSRYLTQPVGQGDVVETVQSTGTVQPLTQVQVGAVVSGRIAKVFVDYNSTVKKGDVLAEIDPTLLGASVQANRAQLAAAEAQVARTRATLATAEVQLGRMERLRAESLASELEVIQSRGQRDVAAAEVAAAQASLGQMRAQLSYSQTNLAYTRIFAPIDGVVVTRNIDPGQTVAASFQAPTLFVIAQDLRRMRVLADVDEADVGKLREGMAAEAAVDAFAGETFRGTVTQVRFSPNTVQGVVTYSAVVEIENPEIKLRPGMTATVTVRTRQAQGVTRMPNAALRYRPSPPVGEGGKPLPVPPEPPLAKGKGRVYVVANGAPGKERVEPLVVDVGITDGIWTELRSAEIGPGKPVVVDETDQADGKKKPGRLF